MKRAFTSVLSVPVLAVICVVAVLSFAAPPAIAQSHSHPAVQNGGTHKSPPPATATAATAATAANGGVQVAQVAPKFYLISNKGANLLLFVGGDTSFVAGVQEPALVKQAVATLQQLHAPPVKYVLVDDDEHAETYGDGGWKARGAVTLTQEKLYARIRRAGGAAPSAASFSDVVQLWIPDEDTHIIHQRAGYSDADTMIHFEHSGILYLGHTLTTDGYPRIDVAKGGKLEGMIETANFFIQNFSPVPDKVEPIIPGRGPVATLRDLTDYRDMLTKVRDRVGALMLQRKSLQEIIAAQPTAEFDAKWGHGPVTPAEFVTMVQESISRN